MASMNVKKGDNVMVITGKDKGKAGEVLMTSPTTGRIVVSGVNMVSKHVKPRKAQEKGGIIEREGTIDVSNVMIICPTCHEVVRVAHKVDGEGKDAVKSRICKKCGAPLDVKKTSAKKAAKNVAKKKASKAKKEEDAE